MSMRKINDVESTLPDEPHELQRKAFLKSQDRSSEKEKKEEERKNKEER
jgi:hypothetical protein